ncbi:hypothetical protein D9M70_599570 [compost metagenome]
MAAIFPTTAPALGGAHQLSPFQVDVVAAVAKGTVHLAQPAFVAQVGEPVEHRLAKTQVGGFDTGQFPFLGRQGIGQGHIEHSR